MVDLFVDIETAPDMTREEYLGTKEDVDSGRLTRDSADRERFWRFKRGGLVPFDGKVILITYKINGGYTHRLKEWEDGEEAILRKFFDLAADLQKGQGDDRLKIIGHNILGFDLFFLYHRMCHYGFQEDKWVYQRIINKPEVVDFLQVHLPLNGFRTKGLKHDVLAHAYGLPAKDSLGSEEIDHYFLGEYDRILEYSEREFVYPELYRKMVDGGIVTGAKLQEAIAWYDGLHGAGSPAAGQ